MPVTGRLCAALCDAVYLCCFGVNLVNTRPKNSRKKDTGSRGNRTPDFGLARECDFAALRQSHIADMRATLYRLSYAPDSTVLKNNTREACRLRNV